MERPYRVLGVDAQKLISMLCKTHREAVFFLLTNVMIVFGMVAW